MTQNTHDRGTVLGLGMAVLSALAFGTSGVFAKGLIQAGWSPAGAVTWRVTIAALLLLGPTLWTMRGRWHLLRRGWPQVTVFGLVAVASCQLAYFQAVERLSVGVALLLEYLGIVLVVGWLWARHGHRPRPLTITGAVLAIAGLALVLDVVGGMRVDGLGVAWGLAAAVGLATYFVVSSDNSTGLPGVAMAGVGLVVGAVGLHLAGALGLVTVTTSTSDVLLAGTLVPWWVSIGGLALVATAVAYSFGVAANRRLGSKVASFVGLTEVMFAVLLAWLVLRELLAPVQLVGAVLLLAGVVAVKLDERAPAVAPDPVPAAADSVREDGQPVSSRASAAGR